MIDFLWKIEHRLTGLNSHLLLAMAIVTIAAGLFALLGGLGFKRILFAVIGAYFGVVFSIFVSGPNLMLTLAIAGTCILLALKLQNGFLALIASIFGALYGFSVLISPYFFLRGELFAIVRQFFIGVPYYHWPILLAVVALPFAASSSYWNQTSAILCSASGASMLVLASMMLMLHSGFGAMAHISIKRELYLEIFAAVVIVGSLVQLFLLPKISSRLAIAKESAKLRAKRAKKFSTDDTPAPKSTTWRTA
jgi:hypothetical protein